MEVLIRVDIIGNKLALQLAKGVAKVIVCRNYLYPV
jgi:hypothetical protein